MVRGVLLPGAMNLATPTMQPATGNRQRESEMKYFLDNPRARVLIGHQNSNPRILLMYQFYIIVWLGFIIAKRGQVIRVKKPWIKKLSECKTVINGGIKR